MAGVGAACLVGVWFYLHAALGLHVNVTPSLPYGLYRLTDQAPAPGHIVRACLPEETSAMALARGYLTAGECPHGTGYVAKVLVARHGDVVEVTRQGTLVNGHLLPNSAPLAHDRGGRTMPVAEGGHVLEEGEVWLYSGYSATSWDSRYYGPVPDSLLRGVVVPVWTWGSPE